MTHTSTPPQSTPGTTPAGRDLFKQTATSLIKQAEGNLEAALETVRLALRRLAADETYLVTADGVKAASAAVAASALADVRAQDALGATCGAAVAADGGAA